MDAQQTQPSDGFYSFLAWLEANKRKVIIWSAAAVVLVIVAIAVISYQAQKERRASEALSNVRSPSTASAGAPPAGTRRDVTPRPPHRTAVFAHVVLRPAGRLRSSPVTLDQRRRTNNAR